MQQPLCLRKFCVFVTGRVSFPIGSGDEAILLSLESTPLFRLFCRARRKRAISLFLKTLPNLSSEALLGKRDLNSKEVIRYLVLGIQSPFMLDILSSSRLKKP